MKSKSSMGSKILESNESIESIYSAEFLLKDIPGPEELLCPSFVHMGSFVESCKENC